MCVPRQIARSESSLSKRYLGPIQQPGTTGYVLCECYAPSRKRWLYQSLHRHCPLTHLPNALIQALPSTKRLHVGGHGRALLDTHHATCPTPSHFEGRTPLLPLCRIRQTQLRSALQPRPCHMQKNAAARHTGMPMHGTLCTPSEARATASVSETVGGGAEVSPASSLVVVDGALTGGPPSSTMAVATALEAGSGCPPPGIMSSL